MPTKPTIAIAHRWALSLGAVAAIAASPAAATTSLMRELNASASILAYVGAIATPSGYTPLDSDNESSFSRDAALLGGEAAADVQLRLLPVGSATSTSKGLWTSDDAGTVELDWGWTLNASSGIAVSASASKAWSYRFIASDDGFFNIRGVASYTGDPTGLNAITLEGSATRIFGDSLTDADGSAAFSIPLLAGQTYEFNLANHGGRASDSGLHTTSAGHATFDWTITYGPSGPAPIPEPGAWAMMILGFGATGAALRRRRSGGLKVPRMF